MIHKKKYFPKYIPNNGLINSSTAFKILKECLERVILVPLLIHGENFFKYKNKKIFSNTKFYKKK